MRSIHLLVASSLAVLGCGGGGDAGTGPVAVATVALAPATIDTLFSIGDSVTLAAVARDAAGATVPGATIAFQSTSVAVATVAPSGAVTAVGNGSSTITATSGAATASVVVRVRQRLARVNVVPGTSGVVIGRTLTLAATGQDARGNAIAGLAAAAFTSSNAGVATVDGGGVVTGRAVGSATITASIASTADGTRTGTATVSVTTAPPLTATVQMGASTFAPTSTEISVGGTVTWVNGSGVPHDVDFGTPAMKIPVFGSGQQSLTFSATGSFGYHCNLHAGMTGTVVVR
jgi:plastocyanin